MYGWPERVDNITRHDLMLQVTEHGNWLSGSLEAKKLYLGYKNLSVLSTLGGLNLTNTDFVESNCEGLVFSNCNLSHCNFIGANLTNASFIDCDLSYSTFLNTNLSSINITNSTLYKVIGNGKEIKNFHVGPLFLTYTSHTLQIDCIRKSLDWWKNATLEDIDNEIQGQGQELDIGWSGFMSPESVHNRLAIMFGLIDSAPAKESFSG